MSYAHLSQDERYQIQHLRRGGFSVREIAKQIERSPSTVSRELFRNGQADEYAARSAQRQSVLRRQAASSQPRIDATVWPGVEARLTEGWSPEQIAGFGDVAVSHERIY
jgi:IS30 family transposase